MDGSTLGNILGEEDCCFDGVTDGLMKELCDFEGVHDGFEVGEELGILLCEALGSLLDVLNGSDDGLELGDNVGNTEGIEVCDKLGIIVGLFDKLVVGDFDGGFDIVGLELGLVVGDNVGSLFGNIVGPLLGRELGVVEGVVLGLNEGEANSLGGEV